MRAGRTPRISPWRSSSASSRTWTPRSSESSGPERAGGVPLGQGGGVVMPALQFPTPARRSAPLLLAIVVAIVAGCAGPRAPVPLPPEAVPPDRAPSGTITDDLGQLGKEEADQGATDRLRQELAQTEDPAHAAEIRMRLAERLEKEGRTGEAVVL